MTSITAYAGAFAVAGLNAAKSHLAIRSQNIANANTEGYAPLKPVQTAGAGGPTVKAVETSPPNVVIPPGIVPSGVDLAEESVGLLTAKRAFEASAAAFKTISETEDRVLDILR